MPREGEEPELLSAAEIFDMLYDIDPRAMRGVNRQNFGAELRSFGVVRTKIGNRRVYEVVKGEKWDSSLQGQRRSTLVSRADLRYVLFYSELYSLGQLVS